MCLRVDRVGQASGITRSGTNRCRPPSGHRPDLRLCRLWLVLLALLTLTLPGCRGCSDADDEQTDKQVADKKKKEEEDRKKKEEKKPDFEINRPYTEPTTPDSPNQPRQALAAKPGHYLAIRQAMKTNHFDFFGELTTEFSEGSAGPTGGPAAPAFQLTDTRPAVLPKGQQKNLEQTLYTPYVEHPVMFTTELRSRGGGTAVASSAEPLRWMPAYQYNFVILAGDPLRYRNWEKLDSMRGPSPYGNHVAWDYYRVVTLPTKQAVPLPSHPLAWTSIAAVLWDDVDTSVAFTADQQRAMLDWLHWGGLLLVSGPDSLSNLRGSFLDPYLPATAGASRELKAADLAELAFYAPDDTKVQQRSPEPIRSWSGVELALKPEGEFCPHAEHLAAERRVGRGRIVVTAFRLGQQRELSRWRGFDSFVNACLLRHPPRKYHEGADEEISGPLPYFVGDPNQNFDPLLTCNLRYLSRDLGGDGTFTAIRGRDAQAGVTIYPTRFLLTASHKWPMIDPSLEVPEHFGPGVGAWNDGSSISRAARDSLGAAAGIDIPRADFVAWMLAGYLVVLVPVNWMLFRLLGRVEWAWVAVPVIAVSGAVIVTKAANLNIGFARSQNEIDVLEVQAGYPRGHLTRYAALYTSLSTTYDVHFPDAFAAVQPLVGDSRPRGATSVLSLGVSHNDAEMQLSGFPVASNSTAMIHTEQMIELGGPISLTINGDVSQVFNGTKMTLNDVTVLRMSAGGTLQTATIGEFPPTKAGRTLEFHDVPTPVAPVAVPTPDQSQPSDQTPDQSLPPDKSPAPAIEPVAATPPAAAPQSAASPTLSLDGLKSLLTNSHGLHPGDVRLIATLDTPLPGMDITPAASQATRGAVLVVIHLRHAPPREPRGDLQGKPDLRGAPIDDAAETGEQKE